MSDAQLLLMFFGLPLAILGVGLRRALGNLALLFVVLVSTVVTGYAVLLEFWLGAAGHGLPLPGLRAHGLVRGFGPFCLGAVLLGALAGILIRYQGRGAVLIRGEKPDGAEKD
jgi:hypothetical protein